MSNSDRPLNQVQALRYQLLMVALQTYRDQIHPGEIISAAHGWEHFIYEGAECNLHEDDEDSELANKETIQ